MKLNSTHTEHPDATADHSARVRELMASGMSAENAMKQAITEAYAVAKGEKGCKRNQA